MVNANFGPDYDLANRLRALERTVAILSTQNILHNSEVGAGGKVVLKGSIEVDDGDITVKGGDGQITVQDDAGDDAVTMGKLSDGTYGLSVTSGGDTMTLSQLAFGLTAATQGSSFSMTGTADTWQDDDNSATFTIVSGQCLVIVSATIAVGASNDPNGFDCYYGYTLSGPTDVAASVNRAIDVNVQQEASRAGAILHHSGLTAGSYTINGAVRRSTGTSGDALPTASASLRSLIVLPY